MISTPGQTRSVKYWMIGKEVLCCILRRLSVRLTCVSYPGGSSGGVGAQQSKESVSRYLISVSVMVLRRPFGLDADDDFLSSSAISRARDVREVRGMRWWRRACCAETSKSHSKAIAWARWGLVCATLRICFVGVRSGRVSRKI